ncbi:helix-turn-helix domain-containing protein [Micromonospora sp. M12]
MVDDVPRPVRGLRRKAVLTVLALHRGEIVSTDRLIDIVWGAERSLVVANTLQSHMSHLRRVLTRPSAIVPRPPGYLLELGPGATDVEVAEDLIKQGTRSTDLVRRGQHLRAALRLWRVGRWPTWPGSRGWNSRHNASTSFGCRPPRC